MFFIILTGVDIVCKAVQAGVFGYYFADGGCVVFYMAYSGNDWRGKLWNFAKSHTEVIFVWYNEYKMHPLM